MPSVSLGTSGVLWATTAGFAPNKNLPIHAFCHAIPNTWHQMGVILSAASSLYLVGACGEEHGEGIGGRARRAMSKAPSPLLFMPYLSGERTPHNDPTIRGAFYGISHDDDARPHDPGGAGRRRLCLPGLPRSP